MTSYSFLPTKGGRPVSIEYAASEDERNFGLDYPVELEGGEADWAPFHADLSVPEGDGGDDPTANPWAVRLRLRHEPPDRGHGTAIWDELAIINWVSASQSLDELALDTPNAVDFLRVEGPAGTHTLTLAAATRRGSDVR